METNVALRILASTNRLARQLCAGIATAVIGFLMALGPVGTAVAAADSQGTDFWIMFNANYSTPQLTLFIAANTATNGVVTIPGLSFSSPFSVVPGTVTSVVLPSAAQVTAVDTIGDLGIHVVANAEVTVYGLNRVPQTTDAFLALPTDILGTDYINLGYGNSGTLGTQFGIVATKAGTSVTITPTATSGSRLAGVPYTIVLNQGQTYQLRSTVSNADLSGSLIHSTEPIGVYGSQQCVNIPNGYPYCDHIVEQLPPTSTWGKSFVTLPLATRKKGDTFRILASTDGTVVSINGSTVATLNRGKFYEQIITGPARITSTKPVLVAQYSNGTTFDGVTSDPFMMLIPPYEQFLAAYTVTTPATGFSTNFINLVVPNAGVGSVTLDGTAIPAASYTAIGTSGFSGVQQAVTLGSHALKGPLPFGAFMYGFASFDSYGYPGGYSLSEVVKVTTISLSPKTNTGPTGTPYCVKATITDQKGLPVPNVRVDFKVSGVNPNAGFANAGTGGIADYCYTGTKPGTDSIVGSVGTLSDTVSKVWENVVTPPLACDVDGNKQVDSTDIDLILGARNTVTTTSTDPRDYNKDGVINILDARQCALRCTKANCAK